MNAPAAPTPEPLAGAQHAAVADLLLRAIGGAIQCATRRPAPPSFAFTALVFLLLNLLIFLLLAVILPLTRALTPNDRLVIAAGAASIPLVTVVVLLTTVLHATLLKMLRFQIAPALTEADTHAFARWLAINLSTRRQLALILIFGGLIGPSVALLARNMIVFEINVSNLIVAVLCGVQGAIYLPTFVTVLALPYHLSRYRLKLHTIDPANSNLVEHLHSVLLINILFIGIFAALIALWLWSFGLLPPQTTIILLATQWIMIASTFSLGQYGLARVIRSVRQRKLNAIQSQIAALEQDGAPANKDAVETILRLVEYYNQVKSMRGSALDIGALLGFLQSLLLPLIASLLANVSAIMQLLRP